LSDISQNVHGNLHSYKLHSRSLCCIQGRIFIFGAQGYFNLGAPLEGLQQLMSYKSAIHVLATFTEQVIPNHKYITALYSEFLRYQKPEPRQPPSILPVGWPRCHMGPKIQSLTPQIKICNIRDQQSFCLSVYFSVLQFIDGAVPVAVASRVKFDKV